MKFLENISFAIEKSMEELKNITVKINKEKENLKLKVSKIFTKLRNALNDREDELLLDIDNKFNEFIFNENIIKQNEKLPNKIKELLIKGKRIENEFKNNTNKISIYINECIGIENSINNIKLLNESIEKFNSQKISYKFIPEEENEINKIIDIIKLFGNCKINEEVNYIQNLESLIIKENKQYNQILKSWINQNKNIKAKLLYRLTRDGDKISTFHELCDNKGPTLILFLVGDGNIGGIYTPLSWDTESKTKYNQETFMFNINKKEKYNNINNDKSIWCLDHFGPWTVNFGFDNTMKKIEHRGNVISESYEKGSEILPNNSNKTKFFDVNEVEVYELLI